MYKTEQGEKQHARPEVDDKADVSELKSLNYYQNASMKQAQRKIRMKAN